MSQLYTTAEFLMLMTCRLCCNCSDCVGWQGSKNIYTKDGIFEEFL